MAARVITNVAADVACIDTPLLFINARLFVLTSLLGNSTA